MNWPYERRLPLPPRVKRGDLIQFEFPRTILENIRMIRRGSFVLVLTVPTDKDDIFFLVLTEAGEFVTTPIGPSQLGLKIL